MRHAGLSFAVHMGERRLIVPNFSIALDSSSTNACQLCGACGPSCRPVAVVLREGLCSLQLL
jgi:ferredoxin